MGYVYVPDSPMCQTNPMQDNDPIKIAKANVRYYKAIIAEYKRNEEKDKKEKEKKTPVNPLSKIKPGHMAAFLLFTWPVFPITQMWFLKILHDYWEAAFK